MNYAWAAEGPEAVAVAEEALATPAGSFLTVATFLFFTGLVAFITWLCTRRANTENEEGFFLAGRSLVFPVIAGSLLLTNLSTEQLVGLNGDAFMFGLHVMAWEVMAVVALVAMALFFLPKFLRSGITTVPEMLEIRFGASTRTICNFIFLVAYATILLPIVLFTGAKGMMSILNLPALTGWGETPLLWITVVAVGVVGSIYALFGGLRSVAVSDLLNGFLLLTGGFMITYFGLNMIGGGEGWIAGLEKVAELNRAGIAAGEINRLNSVGPEVGGKPPFSTLFTGVLVINMFYWCTNQQIIQRTLAARSLAEGQKGVLLTGLLKLFGPLYLVLPGIMAFYLIAQGKIPALPFKPDSTVPDANFAYGALVHAVLPTALTGFFAAAMLGAILSSFNSALNSTCTLFSLGFYKPLIRPDAPEREIVSSGRWFGLVIAAISITIAPMLDGQESIFTYLQTMNTIYFVPIFAVVLVGLTARRVPKAPANGALIGGVAVLVLHYFVLKRELPDGRTLNPLLPFDDYHVAAIVFAALVAFMLVWSKVKPRNEPWIHEYSGRVKLMDPWKWAKPVGAALLILVAAIYIGFADFINLYPKDPAAPPPVTEVVAPDE